LLIFFKNSRNGIIEVDCLQVIFRILADFLTDVAVWQERIVEIRQFLFKRV